ncbi:2-oxoacid:acceptor oxidoreductase family protein [Deltaproteobacteria bacterium]|nr:2-oxoacid:acceptor oxidoreductase family protein [Deltaproteobacteria bacterium]
MLVKTAFAGSGGQGVLMMGYILSMSAMTDGKHVTYLPSYGAEVRGGTANCTVSISDEEIASPVASSPDFAVVLNKPSMTKFQGLIKSGGVMIINSSLVDSDSTRKDIEVIKVPANDIAIELGNERTLNMIMLGAFVEKTGITTQDSIMKGLAEVLKGKKKSIMELNRKGMEKGADYVSKKPHP